MEEYKAQAKSPLMCSIEDHANTLPTPKVVPLLPSVQKPSGRKPNGQRNPSNSAKAVKVEDAKSARAAVVQLREQLPIQ